MCKAWRVPWGEPALVELPLQVVAPQKQVVGEAVEEAAGLRVVEAADA